MALEVESARIINEYQEYFLGIKDGRYAGLTTLTTFKCQLSLNLGA